MLTPERRDFLYWLRPQWLACVDEWGATGRFCDLAMGHKAAGKQWPHEAEYAAFRQVRDELAKEPTEFDGFTTAMWLEEEVEVRVAQGDVRLGEIALEAAREAGHAIEIPAEEMRQFGIFVWEAMEEGTPFRPLVEAALCAAADVQAAQRHRERKSGERAA